MPDPLDPAALCALAPSLVAPDCSLATPAHALALVVHALHSALAFRLVDPAPPPPPAESTDEHATPNRLPDSWPAPGAELKFRYKHAQSSLDFVVSIVQLGDRLLVAGAAVDNPQKSSSFDLVVADYFSLSSFPCPASSLSPSTGTPFSAPHRLKDFVALYRINVLQRLIPGLHKDGYEELPASASSSSGSGAGAGRRGPPYLPDRGGPMGMFPPSNPSRPPRNDPLAIPGSGNSHRGGAFGPLAEIGRRDLDPLGGMGGTFGLGGLGGRGGFGGGLGGGGDDGGGMVMGPDHPLFRERFGPGGIGGGVGGVGGGGGMDGRRWGGDGFLPPMGAPPGARFDPVGPTNGPPSGELGGPNAGGGPFRPGQPQPPPGGGGGAFGGAGGGGGGGPGARQVHPDLERPGTNSEWQNSMFG
ncbi:hypothetical protein Rhopal_007493-T1 [Rhodotorula paludigena]|uniref:Proteasome inhibitor PI31 subunit n=1 Tax=Rhodotorula paludigena TaxID=86838 RepID=A0AAV5GW00_9BASI|nr:hypothetical protein Rhopal_007493-T1 [Rhodotorula paludigena]